MKIVMFAILVSGAVACGGSMTPMDAGPGEGDAGAAADGAVSGTCQIFSSVKLDKPCTSWIDDATGGTVVSCSVTPCTAGSQCFAGTEQGVCL